MWVSADLQEISGDAFRSMPQCEIPQSDDGEFQGVRGPRGYKGDLGVQGVKVCMMFAKMFAHRSLPTRTQCLLFCDFESDSCFRAESDSCSRAESDSRFPSFPDDLLDVATPGNHGFELTSIMSQPSEVLSALAAHLKPLAFESIVYSLSALRQDSRSGVISIRFFSIPGPHVCGRACLPAPDIHHEGHRSEIVLFFSCRAPEAQVGSRVCKAHQVPLASQVSTRSHFSRRACTYMSHESVWPGVHGATRIRKSCLHGLTQIGCRCTRHRGSESESRDLGSGLPVS